MLSIMSYIVVLLTFVIGVSVFTSNRHMKGRISALSLGLAYFGAAFWALFVQLFRNTLSEPQAHIFHQVFTIAALLIPIGFLVYAFSIHRRRTASIVICIIALISIIVIGYLIITNPHLFYTSIVMIGGGNYAVLADTPLVMAYTGVFGIYFSAAIALIFGKALKTNNNPMLRQGLIYMAVGFMISAVFSLIFNLAMPVLGNYDLFWVGSLSISCTMLFTYFATLRYKLFTNSSKILQYSTYLVVVALGAIAYTLLFYLVFMLVFRGANPSDEIITLQFVMVVIVILFLPTINHFIEYIKGMISNNVATIGDDKNDEK